MKHLLLVCLLNMVGIGMVCGQELLTKEDSLSYSTGVIVGKNLKLQGLDNLNVDLLYQALRSTLTDGELRMTPAQADAFLREYQTHKNDAMAAANRKAGEQFLAENEKRPEVTTTTSGLQYEVVEMGSGPKPDATDKVYVHYHGTLIDGTVFDSSVERGEPIEFPLNRVISGWTEVLQLMPVGSKFIAYVPFDLAYGERGAGGAIGPYSTLIFEIELLEIR